MNQRIGSSVANWLEGRMTLHKYYVIKSGSHNSTCTVCHQTFVIWCFDHVTQTMTLSAQWSNGQAFWRVNYSQWYICKIKKYILKNMRGWFHFISIWSLSQLEVISSCGHSRSWSFIYFLVLGKKSCFWTHCTFTNFQ